MTPFLPSETPVLRPAEKKIRKPKLTNLPTVFSPWPRIYPGQISSRRPSPLGLHGPLVPLLTRDDTLRSV